MRNLQAEFNEFDAANPHVWEWYCHFADEAIRHGRTKCGSKEIIERIRWHINLTTTDPNFKICNNHTPYYARKWLALHPEHPEFFVLRELRYHGWDDGDYEQGDLFE